MTFDQAVAFVLEQEGENSYDALGGLTRWGIAQRFHPDIDVTKLTRAGAIDIYRIRYWQKCRCEELPDALRLAVLDAAVNPGPGTSIRFLQRAVGAIADGLIGPQTIAAAHRIGAAALPLMLAERILYYGSRDGFSTNGRGWVRRCLSLQQTELQKGPS